MKRKFLALVFPLLVTTILSSLTSANALAQSRKVPLEPGRIYTNLTTKFAFPPKIADFIREPDLTEFDPAGKDIGIGYNDILHNIAATVFVYPMAQEPPNDTLKGHFEMCKKEVMDKHADVKLADQGKTTISPGGKKQVGLHATFTFTGTFALRKQQPLRSEVYLFSSGKSFVLYRFTYPAERQATSEAAVKTFVDGLEWPK